MRKFVILAGILALLSACAHYEEDEKAATTQLGQDVQDVGTNVETNTMHVADNMRDGIKRTGESIRKWWITPPPGNKKLAIATSYCYTVLHDVLCYRQPMPGWENRLVGYQGTGALPPPPAVMQPLPLQAKDEKRLPENRVASAQAVFKEIPEETKAKEQEQVPGSAEAPPAEAAHETLPDPALAPQL